MAGVHVNRPGERLDGYAQIADVGADADVGGQRVSAAWMVQRSGMMYRRSVWRKGELPNSSVGWVSLSAASGDERFVVVVVVGARAIQFNAAAARKHAARLRLPWLSAAMADIAVVCALGEAILSVCRLGAEQLRGHEVC